MSNLLTGVKAIVLLTSTTAILLAATPARAASAADLLEKGIYAEETKGDLDGALQLYQQVVKEGKAGEAVAAQAQYRLGVCFYKKKNYTEATAAFEKLIKDYADQKDLVTLASQYLAGAASLLPTPWADGEELRFDIKFATGFKLGVAHYTADAAETNGHKIWRLGMALSVGIFQGSHTEVEADSFKPLHSRWKHTLIGDADTVYLPDHAEVKLNGKDDIKKIELQGVVYDNEEAVQLMRRLPLATNYSTSMRVLSALGGGNIIPFKIEVTGRETVKVPAGTFDCYRVELSIHQTFWYSTDTHRYLVKFEAGGVICELAEINVRQPGAPVRYQDPAFTLTAPPDWLFCRLTPRDDKNSLHLLIVDPEGAAATQMTARSLESLKAEAKNSVRAWATNQVAEAGKALTDLKARPESWQDRTVGGAPAVSLIADYLEGETKKIAYGVFMFSGTNAVELYTSLSAGDFEGFRPGFDAMVDSYQAK